jgi:hypothetical protein
MTMAMSPLGQSCKATIFEAKVNKDNGIRRTYRLEERVITNDCGTKGCAY